MGAQAICGSTQEVPRNLIPQAQKLPQTKNGIMLKHYSFIDIRLQSECFVCSWTRSCASRSTASLGMSHQKRNQYLDGMPRCNIGKQFKSVCNITFIIHEFVMHVTLEMLLFKVSYNRHAPKLLHLGALTFDRCWPWWSKAVLPCIRHRCGELQKMGLPALGLWLSTKASSRCSQKQGTIWYILCTGFRCQYQLGTRIIIRVQLPNVQYLRVQAMTYLSKSAIQDWPGCAKCYSKFLARHSDNRFVLLMASPNP